MIPQRIFFTFAISLISFDQIAENNEKKKWQVLHNNRVPKYIISISMHFVMPRVCQRHEQFHGTQHTRLSELKNHVDSPLLKMFVRDRLLSQTT